MTSTPTPQSHMHQPATVPARPVLIGVGVVALAIALSMGVTRWWLESMHSGRGLMTGGAGENLEGFQGPRLWGPAGRDLLDALHAREERNLRTYRWLDDAHTHAAIPIDRAFDLMLSQHGVEEP